MAKTISISEDSIIAMLKGLSENTLMDIFSRMLIESDTAPLTAEEKALYNEALSEHEKGDTISWQNLK